MLNTPFSPWPSFTDEEGDAVREVLLSNRVNYWTGEHCKAFEREFAAWVECDYAVSLANGTVALELALEAIGLSAGDEVIVTPRTFIASASAIVRQGAIPVFADVDLQSQNITASSIEKCLSAKTRAILCVHLAGWPCDMDDIVALAKRENLRVIEDCAQAHGARYKGKSVGSLGDIACWSFCQDKVMSTGGEGGMITTSDESLWQAVWSLKDHGKSQSAIAERTADNGFKWVHDSFGTNARMTEMQAVVGRIQLSRMPEWHRKRRENLTRIWNCARELPLYRVPTLPQGIDHAAYKCYLHINPDMRAGGEDIADIRAEALTRINELGVPCYAGSCPTVFREKAFDCEPWLKPSELPNAEILGKDSLMLLVHPTLTEAEISKTLDVLSKVSRVLAG